MGENDFCTCSNGKDTEIGFEDEHGYWEVCCSCGKKIAGEHHYYNHYDGVDHDDIDMW